MTHAWAYPIALDSNLYKGCDIGHCVRLMFDDGPILVTIQHT
jgi:hypothetical protein